MLWRVLCGHFLPDCIGRFYFAPNIAKFMTTFAWCWGLIQIYFTISNSASFPAFMMTWSYGNIFHVTALCAANSPVNGEFLSQRPVTQSFDSLLICAWINAWVNNREAGVLRRHRTHYDVFVMEQYRENDTIPTNLRDIHIKGLRYGRIKYGRVIQM